jgi:hypothetical protein
MLKARHLRTREDPVINDQMAKLPRPSGHQIMSLLELGAQNALLVDNATESEIVTT